MPTKTSRLGSHIRDLEAKVPLTFDLFSGRRQPACQRGEVIFFEDLTANSGKIIMRVGNSTYVFTSSLVGSGIDHGGLAGLSDDDHPQYLLVSGVRPLTGPWDAGNFAITLGSIVGKSGNLSITPASGGNIGFSSSIASGASNYGWAFTDTVARTAGGYLRITDSAANNPISVNAPTSGTGGVLLALGAATDAAYGTILSFQLQCSSTSGTASGTISRYTNSGAGSAHGLFAQGTAANTSSPVTGQRITGAEFVASYSALSPFSTRATDRISGLTSIIGWANNSAVGGVGVRTISWGLYVGNVTTPNPLPIRWAGALIGARPTGLGDAATAGVHSVEGFSMASGQPIVFDSAVTMTPSVTQGSSTWTAYTRGTTTMYYDATNLNTFVAGSQAFHFAPGGAAGTSRCYGNMLISGTTTSTGTLIASAAATVGTTLDVTGLVTAAVGVSATTGNITTVAGDLVSASDVFFNGYLGFDGTANNAMILSGGSIGVFLGGNLNAQISTSGVDVSAGNAFTIDSAKLTIAEAQLTHAPTSAATYTIDLNDALLITDDSNNTARSLVEIKRQSSTGNRSVFKVLTASATTGLEVWSQAGVAYLGLYGVTAVTQPSSTGETTGYTGGGGTALTHSDTFTGNSGTKAYTINDIVKHLKALGALATS